MMACWISLKYQGKLLDSMPPNWWNSFPWEVMDASWFMADVIWPMPPFSNQERSGVHADSRRSIRTVTSFQIYHQWDFAEIPKLGQTVSLLSWSALFFRKAVLDNCHLSQWLSYYSPKVSLPCQCQLLLVSAGAPFGKAEIVGSSPPGLLSWNLYSGLSQRGELVALSEDISNLIVYQTIHHMRACPCQHQKEIAY